MYQLNADNRKFIGLRNIVNLRYFTDNMIRPDEDIFFLICHIASKLGIPFMEGKDVWWEHLSPRMMALIELLIWVSIRLRHLKVKNPKLLKKKQSNKDKIDGR